MIRTAARKLKETFAYSKENKEIINISINLF
jgi:hypothetical protein